MLCTTLLSIIITTHSFSTSPSFSFCSAFFSSSCASILTFSHIHSNKLCSTALFSLSNTFKMSFRSALLAATALIATASSHIIMESPVPYSNDKIDNSPITAAQFPCKVQNGFTVTKMNSMKVGETQKISFKGSAVHGGGSCQLSYTQDTTPTANSKFKVIKSIEGGCPGVDGVKTFDFTLPDSIPSGKGTFAWTWNSKMAGQPELYMNCAPIDVSGGASDASGLDSLPDTLFVNRDPTSCKQVENKVVKFPNPGKDVESDGTGVAPVGSGCGSSSGGSDDAPAPGAGGASSAPATKPTSSAAAGAPSAAPTTGASKPTSSAAAPKPTASDPVFAPGASSALPSVVPTTLATAVAPSSPAGTASPPTATGSPSTGAPSTGSPSTGGASGSCSEDGAIVCNGATQFGICNKGQVTWQAVAAGTQCADGKIAKRGYNGRIARPRY